MGTLDRLKESINNALSGSNNKQRLDSLQTKDNGGNVNNTSTMPNRSSGTGANLTKSSGANSSSVSGSYDRSGIKTSKVNLNTFANLQGSKSSNIYKTNKVRYQNLKAQNGLFDQNETFSALNKQSVKGQNQPLDVENYNGSKIDINSINSKYKNETVVNTLLASNAKSATLSNGVFDASKLQQPNTTGMGGAYRRNIKYDENGKPYYDANSQANNSIRGNVKYDASGKPYYDASQLTNEALNTGDAPSIGNNESGNTATPNTNVTLQRGTIRYDENGKPYYDTSRQTNNAAYRGNIQYDENGKPYYSKDGKTYGKGEQFQAGKIEYDGGTYKAIDGIAPKGLHAGDKVDYGETGGIQTIGSVNTDGSYNYIVDHPSIKGQVESVTAQERFENSGRWNRTDDEAEKKRLADRNLELGNRVGYVRDEPTGAWYKDADKTQKLYNDPEENVEYKEGGYKYSSVSAKERRNRENAAKALNADIRDNERYNSGMDAYHRYVNDYNSDNPRIDKSVPVVSKVGQQVKWYNNGDTDYWDSNMAAYTKMTDDERNAYEYLYSIDQDKAKEFLKAYKNTVGYQKTKEQIAEDAKQDAENPALSLITTPFANAVLSAISNVQNIYQSAKNALGIGEYQNIGRTDFNAMSEYGSSVRQNVIQNILNDESIPQWKKTVLTDGYQVASAIGDMAVASLIAGGAGNSSVVAGIMSGSAANQATLDALDRGATNEQAGLEGAVFGAAEYLAERVSLGMIFNSAKPIKNVKSLAAKSLQSAAAEGSEELVTNIAQSIGDSVILGDKSSYSIRVQEYMSQGLSKSEAEKKASMDIYLWDSLQAAKIGALTGGVVSTTLSTASQVSTGRYIKKNSAIAIDLATTARQANLDPKYDKTIDKVLDAENTEKLKTIELADLKGALEEHYQNLAKTEGANIYRYVGLNGDNLKLTKALGKFRGNDETGFQNERFNTAWVEKSKEMMDVASAYMESSSKETAKQLEEYLEYANILNYGNLLSSKGNVANYVRAYVNEVLNRIPASAAGMNIISEDTNLYLPEPNPVDYMTMDAFTNNEDEPTFTEANPEGILNYTINKNSDGKYVLYSNGKTVKTFDTKAEAQQYVKTLHPSYPDTTVTDVETQNAASEQQKQAKADEEKLQSLANEYSIRQSDDGNYEVVHNNEVVESYPNEISALAYVQSITPYYEAQNVSQRVKSVDDYTVGQKKGNTVTYHKSAMDENDSINARNAETVIADKNYDLVQEKPRSNSVTFIYTDGFNQNTEPKVVGRVEVKLSKNGTPVATTKPVGENEIIVDKSEYVPVAYNGFNVEQQRIREQLWKNSGRNYDSTKITDADYFNEKFGDLFNEQTIKTIPSDAPAQLTPEDETFLDFIAYHPIYLSEKQREQFGIWEWYDENSFVFLTDLKAQTIDGKTVVCQTVDSMYNAIVRQFPRYITSMNNGKLPKKLNSIEKLETIISATENVLARAEQLAKENSNVSETETTEQKESSRLDDESKERIPEVKLYDSRKSEPDSADAETETRVDADNGAEAEVEQITVGNYTIEQMDDGKWLVNNLDGYAVDEYDTEADARAYALRETAKENSNTEDDFYVMQDDFGEWVVYNGNDDIEGFETEAEANEFMNSLMGKKPAKKPTEAQTEVVEPVSQTTEETPSETKSEPNNATVEDESAEDVTEETGKTWKDFVIGKDRGVTIVKISSEDFGSINDFYVDTPEKTVVIVEYEDRYVSDYDTTTKNLYTAAKQFVRAMEKADVPIDITTQDIDEYKEDIFFNNGKGENEFIYESNDNGYYFTSILYKENKNEPKKNESDFYTTIADGRIRYFASKEDYDGYDSLVSFNNGMTPNVTHLVNEDGKYVAYYVADPNTNEYPRDNAVDNIRKDLESASDIVDPHVITCIWSEMIGHDSKKAGEVLENNHVGAVCKPHAWNINEANFDADENGAYVEIELDKKHLGTNESKQENSKNAKAKAKTTKEVTEKPTESTVDMKKNFYALSKSDREYTKDGRTYTFSYWSKNGKHRIYVNGDIDVRDGTHYYDLDNDEYYLIPFKYQNKELSNMLPDEVYNHLENIAHKVMSNNAIQESKPKSNSKKTSSVTESEVEPTTLKAKPVKGKAEEVVGSNTNANNNTQGLATGSLYKVIPQKDYGKTSEAKSKITKNSEARANNIKSVLNEFTRLFGKPIIQKRHRNMGNVLGWFDTELNQIHTQQQEQLGTALHEIGHFLDRDGVLVKSQAVDDILNNTPNLKQALANRGYSDAEMKYEVIADFIYKYLTNPDAAWELGSYARGENFYDTFESLIGRDRLVNLKNLRSTVLAYISKDVSERIAGESTKTRGQIKQEAKLGVKDLKDPEQAVYKAKTGIMAMYEKFQTDWVDSTYAANKLVKNMEKISGEKLDPEQNLQLVLEMSGSCASVTDSIITKNLLTPDGTIINNDNLQDIIAHVEEQGKKLTGRDRDSVFKDFSSYLFMKHALDRERLGQTTISKDATNGNTIDEYETKISDLETKYKGLFEEQADRIYDWYDTIMKEWLVNAGMLEQESYDKMRSMYPHYVPMFRVMDIRHNGVDTKGSKKGVNPLKRVSKNGSTRETYNVIENLMVQVNNIVTAYHRNAVGVTIHDLLNDPKYKDIMGSYIDVVTDDLGRNVIDMESAKNKLKRKILKEEMDSWSAAQRQWYKGLSDKDKADVKDRLSKASIIDETINDVVTQFLPTGTNNDPDTITCIVNGQKHYYRILDPNLARAIMSSSPTVDTLVGIGKLTRAFTSVTTSLNFIFAINNAIRDYQHAKINIDAEHWWQNFTFGVEWGKALVDAMAAEFGFATVGYKGNRMYNLYKSTTGFDRKYQAGQDTLEKVMENSRKRNRTHPFVATLRLLEALNTAVEATPRFVAFKRKYAATGNVMLAGKAARESTVNFNRKGIKTKTVGQVVPFLGAAIAGINQTATLITDPNTYKTRKGQEKLARALVTQAIPAILLAFMNAGYFTDDEEKKKEYDQISEDMKNNYWVFKLGDTWFKLPKDREYSAIFGTTFQNYVLNKLYPDERDDATDNAFLSYLIGQFMPSIAPTGWALMQAHNNKTWYGGNIISTQEQKMLDPETMMDITDDSTSKIAEWVAGVINKGPGSVREKLGVLATPKGAEYTLDQLFGIIADFALPLTTETERGYGLLNTLTTKYTLDENKGSRYTSEAYALYDHLEALNTAGKLSEDEEKWFKTIKATMNKSTSDNSPFMTVGDYFSQNREYKTDITLTYQERQKLLSDNYEKISAITYDMMRAYKNGETPKSNYGDVILSDEAKEAGFTEDTFSDAYNLSHSAESKYENAYNVWQSNMSDDQKQFIMGKYELGSIEDIQRKSELASAAGIELSRVSEITEQVKDKKYGSETSKAIEIMANASEYGLDAQGSVAVANFYLDLTKSYNSGIGRGKTRQDIISRFLADGGTPQMYDDYLDAVKAAGATKMKDKSAVARQVAGGDGDCAVFLFALGNPTSYYVH